MKLSRLFLSLLALTLCVALFLPTPVGADCDDPDPANCDDVCSDTRDNDGDGRVDCEDPDCTDNQFCAENCSNGQDDDADGDVDCDDTECVNDPACSGGGDEDCSNGVDDDGDGDVDCVDEDCVDDPACDSEDNCNDGRDNDGDGETDCSDPDCSDDPACPENCENGRDDDADGDVDCDDSECAGDPACGEDCGNGRDDDGDGCVDGDDSNCGGTETDCRDGVDNDCDGLIDDDDAQDCGARSETCGNGRDDDMDGCTDDEDSECGGTETDCSDGVDNDCDTQLDCSDPDCGSRTCDDGVSCTTGDTCRGGRCEGSPDDSLCDNGLFCDGREFCDAERDCQAGTDPCPDPGEGCDEADELCIEEDCLDEIDNDGDGAVDGRDTDCAICGNGVCEISTGESKCICEEDCGRIRKNEPGRRWCSNGQDDDCDGLTDCEDEKCATHKVCEDALPTAAAVHQDPATGPKPMDRPELLPAPRETSLEDVSLATGALVYERTDVVLPLTWDGREGLPLTRIYHSRREGSGWIGAGWSLGLIPVLELDGETPLIHMADSGETRLRFDAENGDGLLVDGAHSGYTLQASPGRYLLRGPDGRSCLYAGEGAPRFCRDQAGDLLRFLGSGARPDGLADSRGGHVRLSWDEDGRLTGVTDALGREVLYAYDDRGNLAETRVLDAAGWPRGETEQYRYSWGADREVLNHNLVDITSTREGRSRQGLTHRHFVYGTSGDALDRVLEASRRELPGAAAATWWSFHYEAVPGGLRVAVEEGERAGPSSLREYLADPSGRLLGQLP